MSLYETIFKSTIFILIFNSCGNSQYKIEESPKANIILSELRNEVIEVDSVLINGIIPIVCTLDSAIMAFGDTLLSYQDYRFPYFDHTDTLNNKPNTIFVFQSAVFREWRNGKVILLKLNFEDGNYLSYSNKTISQKLSNFNIAEEFPNSTKLSMIDYLDNNSGSNAITSILEIRATNKVFEYSKMKWKFIFQTGILNSVEFYNIRQ